MIRLLQSFQGGKSMANWIDNMIGFVSPERGAKREAWRQNMEYMRSNYDAGGHSRLNANWRVTNQSAEFTDRYDRENVRARARDLERNSDMMNSVVGAFKRNVVGGGYNLQITTGNKKINEQLQAAWKKWCKKRNCDVTGTQSFMQIMRMAVERKKVDGGIMLVKRYTELGCLPFQIQAVEVDELDSSQMIAKNAGNKVVGGIEYNSYNRPIGYWIRQYSLDGFSVEEPKYLEAKDVIFYFTKKRPSQVREISDMSQTITRIRDANEFMTAVSVKERIMACFSVFIKKAIPTTGIGRGNQNSGPQHDYEGKTLAPGMIKEMNIGDEAQVINPTGQSADASQYIKQMQRLVGAGQGISYEATARDMSETNYSSARQGSIEDDMTYQEEKELLIEIMDEIYETFVISCYMAGMVDIPDFWEKKEKYMAHEWIQVPKRWIDPLKEANANKIALQTLQKTFQDICSENGRDWKKQIDSMADLEAYAKGKGIDITSFIYTDKKNDAAKSSKKDDKKKEEEVVSVGNNGNNTKRK